MSFSCCLQLTTDLRPAASPVTPGRPAAAYTGIRAPFRPKRREGVAIMLYALGRAALGTGFTFGMTALGAAMVFFLTGEPRPRFRRTLLGFAAGVMTAASVWSLLLPAMDRAAGRRDVPRCPARRRRNAGGGRLSGGAGRPAAPSAPPAGGRRLAAERAAGDRHHPPQRAGGHGGGAGLRPGAGGRGAGRRRGTGPGHRHPELSGGGRRGPAPAGGRPVPGAGPSWEAPSPARWSRRPASWRRRWRRGRSLPCRGF